MLQKNENSEFQGLGNFAFPRKTAAAIVVAKSLI